MSRENVGIVRAFFEAYLRGDYDEALSWLAPDVVYQVGQEVPAQGPEAVRAVWERWESDWEELETIPEEYLDAGDRVMGGGLSLGTGSGQPDQARRPPVRGLHAPPRQMRSQGRVQGPIRRPRSGGAVGVAAPP
jgi:ketosteroid isomerase-like protein